LSDFFAAITGTQTVQASSTEAGSTTNSNSTNAAASDSTGSNNVQTSAALTPATNSDPSQSSDAAPTVVDNSALMPQEGPSGTIADIEKTKNGVISVYVVEPGDTLSGIAAHFGVTEGTILGANNLTLKSVIQPGDQLIIMSIDEIPYTVKQGDTLESIAKRFGGDATDIGDYNGVDDSTLVVGSQINIPGGEASAPVVSTTVTSTPPKTGSGTKKPKPVVTTTPSKPTASTKILQGSQASGNIIPMANNPDEPARGVGPVGSPDEIAYYTSPLTSFIQTQNIHGWNAVDLAAPSGTPIMAAAAGEVIIAKEGGYNGGYGSYVVITHDNGSQTLYAHMSKVAATVGEEVAQGQVIGYVGETGDATGPHVHFEIRNGIRNPF
jgi:murein DD-endopeptidase MepM/ murein hydrolase activator NlpD